MAVTATHLTTDGTDVDATSFTTASISPSANKLVLVAVMSAFAGGPTTPTVSGAGMTWTQVATDTVANTRLTIFRALDASPGSGALTIDFGAESEQRIAWSISEFDGIDTGGTNGANAIVQTASNTIVYTVASTGITVTLAAFGKASNATFGVVGMRAGGNPAITEGTGFTELGEATTGAELGRIETQWRNDNDTSVDWTWASTLSDIVGIAIELNEFTSSPSSSPSLSPSPSSSISNSPSPSPSASQSASPSPSASISPSPSPAGSNTLSVDLVQVCFAIAYDSKYSAQGNTYTDKYSTQGNTYTDKYSSVGNTFTDKYTSKVC